MFRKIVFFCITEKDLYVDTYSDDKESIMLFLHKNAAFFYP